MVNKKQKFFLFIFGMVILLANISPVSGVQIGSQKASAMTSVAVEVNVAVTTTTLADFVGYLVGQEIEPIINPGTCPAHYDSEPGDLVLVQEADVVFCHGFEGQWLDDLLTSANKTAAKYPLGPLVAAAPWGVPANAKRYLEVITAKLNTTYPSLADSFNTKLVEYEQLIDLRATTLQSLAQNYSLVGKKAVVMIHQYGFVNFLGLDIVANWSKSDELMSVQEVANLIVEAANAQAEIVISNLQSGTSVGAEVANELKIPHAILTNFPGSDPSAGNYTAMLSYNLLQLKAAVESTGNNPNSLLVVFLGLTSIIVVSPILTKITRWKKQRMLQ